MTTPPAPPAPPRLDPEEVPGAQQPVPLRAFILSLAALATATWGALSSPEILAGYDALSWLLALFPAFLLAYYRGWRGAAHALAGGGLLLILVEFSAEYLLQIEVDWLLLLLVTVVLLAVGLGLGVLSEFLRRERAAALLLAHSDPVVGLPNQRMLDFMLEKDFAAAERGVPLAVVLFDVDGFRNYNERYGHRLGDEALRRIAATLGRETRRMNLTGRCGGDEFLSILGGEDSEGARSFAERIRQAVADLHLPGGTRRTLSVGIASYEPSMGSPAELLDAADRALYRAKTLGGNTCCVFEPTAEEALRRSEEHFRLLIENASDVITIFDADGRIRYHSPSAERVLGYPAHDLTRERVFESIHPDDAPRLAGLAAEVVETPGTTRSVEYRFRHRDGAWRVLESIGNNLLRDPIIAGIVIYSRDITERKRLEEQLHQSQKMEVVGRLAGGVAHDFNNLLTAITCHSALVLGDLAADDPLRAEVEEIQSAVQRGTQLTRQLLVFSRKEVLQREVLDLNAIVSDMDKLLRRLIGEDIELVTRLDRGLGRVRADRGQIEQVIMNLAVNARDAMPQGGKLTIETRNLDVHPHHANEHSGNGQEPGRGGPYVALAVTDTGCGMDPDVQSRIFEPFFTTKEDGTGLGLSTVYGIVQQSGGSIRVDSEPGGGTSFQIVLPAVEEVASSPAPRPARSGSARGSEVVLLVEDEDAVRSLVGRVLRHHGYTVLDASEGGAALRIFHRHDGPIHLLLTDVVMPGMNGRELAERVVSLRPQIRLLYMSGYADNPLVQEAVQDAGTAFLEKPFTPDALAQTVRQVLDAPEATAGVAEA